MRRAKPLEPEVRADMVDRYRRGQGMKFISYALGHAPETVRGVLVAAGVKIRRQGRHASGNWGYTGGRA